MKPSLGGRLAALFFFAGAMGWLEAVVVVYIRALLGIAPGETASEAQILSRFRSLPWLMGTEQGREVATLLMLGAVAWLAGRGARGRVGAFLVSFGVWDVVYYVGLCAMLRWPPSLLAMDMLFLIPPARAWYQPVWAPVAISIGMIAVGVRLFRGGRPAGRSA